MRRSSVSSAAARGNAASAVQTFFGDASSVCDPITIASAHARRSAITNRSASLASAITRFELGIPGSATTPSIVSTKFAYTQSAGKPSVPG